MRLGAGLTGAGLAGCRPGAGVGRLAFGGSLCSFCALLSPCQPLEEAGLEQGARSASFKAWVTSDPPG